MAISMRKGGGEESERQQYEHLLRHVASPQREGDDERDDQRGHPERSCCFFYSTEGIL